jgi:hypothetical protein
MEFDQIESPGLVHRPKPELAFGANANRRKGSKKVRTGESEHLLVPPLAGFTLYSRRNPTFQYLDLLG